jgi:hypothetical protein
VTLRSTCSSVSCACLLWFQLLCIPGLHPATHNFGIVGLSAPGSLVPFLFSASTVLLLQQQHQMGAALKSSWQTLG